MTKSKNLLTWNYLLNTIQKSTSLHLFSFLPKELYLHPTPMEVKGKHSNVIGNQHPTVTKENDSKITSIWKLLGYLTYNSHHICQYSFV